MANKQPARVVQKNNHKKTTSTISFKKIVEAAKQEAIGSKSSAYLATTIATGLIYTIIGLIIHERIIQKNIIDSSEISLPG